MHQAHSTDVIQCGGRWVGAAQVDMRLTDRGTTLLFNPNNHAKCNKNNMSKYAKLINVNHM